MHCNGLCISEVYILIWDLLSCASLDSDTLKLMNTPRCSLPDIIGSEDKLKKRRRKRRYSLTQPEVDTIMTYALKAWSDVTNLKFHATSSSEQDRADIKISFARSLHDDGYPFDGKGGTLAHAFFPGEADVAGDTHFDDEESWTYIGMRRAVSQYMGKQSNWRYFFEKVTQIFSCKLKK
uniref:Peptidase metallopeptidase domain-containing protein n=1 Tax=Sinocyclocheilus grahami TaxID=75366 RepID=A0A672RMP8_SINGR